jgi:HD-GYP domain-containing protein (c-di-GMP phosphodiesterase class II)
MSPFEAKDIIVKGSGTDFDPQVVNAFLAAFRFGEMDVSRRGESNGWSVPASVRVF